MRIIVREYYSLNKKQKEEFFKFLSDIDESSPASKNMWDYCWEDKPNTLPYILEHTDRYFESRGEFIVLYNNNQVIGCGGVYKSNFNSDIAIAGSRTYIDPKYRNQSLLREYLLPFNKEWATNHNCKIVSLSFNEYNKNIIEIFKRRRLGETLDRINTRNKPHMFYSGLHEVTFPVNIQYTKQYVIYEKLDKNYDYDWELIKWQE
jgi:GNAT superfamily N-acetyltransferase